MIKKTLFYLLVSFGLWSCSLTKNVPEGKYLLSSVKIKTDTKGIDTQELHSFVRQSPNSNMLFFGKVGLRIHSIAGRDTSKIINKWIQGLGEAPIIFNEGHVSTSATQLQKELGNQGYLQAEVNPVVNKKGKKVSVEYNIRAGTPYRIRNYECTVEDSLVAKLFARSKPFSKVKPEMLFNKEVLESERVRLNNLLRNVGYYSFSKEFLYYKADTTLNTHQVDLFFSLYPPKDSTSYRRYKYRNVYIMSGYDPLTDDEDNYFEHPDTIKVEGINLIYGKNNFLRPSVLIKNNRLRPGTFFSDQAYSRTFSAFNGLGAIKQTNIRLVPILSKDSVDYLDVHMSLAPANPHWFQLAVDGTNSAGDLGIAPSVSYQHKNLFNGAEIFALRLKGAYEFVSGAQSTTLQNESYFEYGVETSLSFPQFLFPWLRGNWRNLPSTSTQLSLGINNQYRPEYTRQFFYATLTYRWQTKRSRMSHALDLLDVNYVRMPWVSEAFRREFLNQNLILRATYEDQLISRTAYGITYTNRTGTSGRDAYTIRAGVDIAGLLPRLATTIANTPKDSLGQRQVLGINYAEYLKGDISFTQTHTLDPKHKLAYHVLLGVANPFGNSSVIPFERRYFSGGANSVRGWPTRLLGPGSFNDEGNNVFVNHTGDIKLDLSIEYRAKTKGALELATFIDAGNIWTIRSYDTQPNGLFRFSEFYKEIAVAYGFGFRFDLNFLLIRLDFGMKAYDPSRPVRDRLILFKPNLSRDLAWHFAIGYPF